MTRTPLGSAQTTEPRSLCPNCGAALSGSFCASCGQKAAALNPLLREFLRDTFHELVDFDGRIFRTLRLLFTRPGFLSNEYIAGRRVRYLSPVRLYLLASILCISVTSVVPLHVRIRCTSCAPEVRAVREQEMGEALAGWVPRAMFVLVKKGLP